MHQPGLVVPLDPAAALPDPLPTFARIGADDECGLAVAAGELLAAGVADECAVGDGDAAELGDGETDLLLALCDADGVGVGVGVTVAEFV